MKEVDGDPTALCQPSVGGPKERGIFLTAMTLTQQEAVRVKVSSGSQFVAMFHQDEESVAAGTEY